MKAWRRLLRAVREIRLRFDAYGTGAAPNLTGYYAVPATAWVLVTGNAWKAPVPATYTTINFCLFGSVWGQKVAAVVVKLDGAVGFLSGEWVSFMFTRREIRRLTTTNRSFRWR